MEAVYLNDADVEMFGHAALGLDGRVRRTTHAPGLTSGKWPLRYVAVVRAIYHLGRYVSLEVAMQRPVI